MMTRAVRARPRRRLLRVDAAVPLQRGAGGLGGRRWHAGARWCCGASSPHRSSFPTSGVTARRTPTTSASRCPTSWPHPNVADDADNPLRAVYGNEGAPATSTGSRERFGTHRRRRIRFHRGRSGHRRVPRTPRRARWARCPTGTEIVDVETGEPCPPGVTGEIVNTAGPGRFEGYYNDPEAEAERMARRRLPQRRPRLPRRERLRVFRRSARRLDARRRREPRRRADRAGAAAPPGRHRGRRIRDPRPRRRRPGDGGAGAARTAPRSMSTPSASSWPGSPTWGPSSGPSFVRIAGELPRTESFKVIKRQLAAEGTDCADAVFPIRR